MRQVQGANLIKVDLSPSASLFVFHPYRVNSYVSGNDAGLWEHQQAIFGKIVLVKDCIIGP